MVDHLELGTVVKSTGGRDAGSLFVVVGRQGPDVVLVADGRKRTINRPKRKNPRHLLPRQKAGLDSVLSPGGMLTDESIRAFLDHAMAEEDTAYGESRES